MNFTRNKNFQTSNPFLFFSPRGWTNLILSLLLPFILINSSFAQESSPSAILEEQVKEKIQERLEQVANQDLEKIKGVIEKKMGKIYAYSGLIKEVKDAALKIETSFGSKEVKVASQAAILKVSPGKAKSEVKLEDLEVDDFVIAIGPMDSNQVITGKRLIITDTAPASQKRKLLFGKVTEIDGQKITFKNSQQQSITVDSKTKLKINGLEKPVVEDIQIGDLIRVIVTLDKSDKIDEIKVVMVIPGEASPAAEENEVEATPSAASS